jgi:hypothetical protein
MKNLKLKNPTSPRHLVRLHAKQKLELVTSDENAPVVTGPFLRTVSSSINDKKEHVFIVEPTESILQYVDLSTHYLGEIIVGTNTIVMVYLEPKTKNNVVSIINPFNDSIRIRPFNIVEFIYASEYQNNIVWSWELKEDIDLVEIEYKTSQFDLPVTETNQHYVAHYRDVFSEKIMVHHFWFKLDRGLLTAMQQKPQKDVYVGRLAIEGANATQDYDDCFVDIYCDLIPKWRTNTVDFMVGKQVFNTAQSGKRRSFIQSMKVDFELLDTKSAFAGCKIMEPQV